MFFVVLRPWEAIFVYDVSRNSFTMVIARKFKSTTFTSGLRPSLFFLLAAAKLIFEMILNNLSFSPLKESFFSQDVWYCFGIQLTK